MERDGCEPAQTVSMRLCFVGCGEISARHAAAIRLVNARRQAKAPDSRLADHVVVVAAVDPVESAAAAVAEDFRDHGCVAFGSLGAALGAATFDAVLLMVPPALNEELASLALRHDKSVLLQKPLAISEERAQSFLAAVDEMREEGHRGCLLVSEHSQWWPEVLTAKCLVEEGRIGELVTARSNFYGGLGGIDGRSWRSKLDQGGGGICMDGGTHWIRPLRLWFGEVVAVQGMTARLAEEAEGETLAKAIFHHGTRAPLPLCLSVALPLYVSLCLYLCDSLILCRSAATPLRLSVHEVSGSMHLCVHKAGPFVFNTLVRVQRTNE